MSDLQYAFRQLGRNPGYSLVAVLTLGLGIGLNTSMFTGLQALLNRSLPYPEPDRLVQIFRVTPGSPRGPHHSAPDVLDYRDSGTFEHLAALNDKSFNLAEPGQPAERVRGLLVTADLFPLLGMAPALGRVFTVDEDQPGRNAVVLLDHGFWQRRFAGDPNIVGRVLRLEGEPVTVVGVMPARFRDPLLVGPVSLWRPMAFTEGQRQQRSHYFLKCIARLRPGQALGQGQAAADVLAHRQRQQHPDGAAERLRLEPLAQASLPPQARAIVWSIMALAGLVLLIACANLANLQFARTTLRRREFSIRGALGAARLRLLRQVLTESLVLALLGGGLGLVLSHWGRAFLQRQFVVEGEILLQLPLNWRVLAFAFTVATLSGLAFGLAPAWLASRADVNGALKQGGRGAIGDRPQHRIQHTLIVAEVALALTLLAGAGLVVQGLRGFARQHPGWDVEGLTLGYVTLSDAKYGDAQTQRAFATRLEGRLRDIPGAEQVALCWNLPLRQFNVRSSFAVEGRPPPSDGPVPECFVNGVTPGYFDALRIPLLAGRGFTEVDGPDRPPVVIINETLARAFWPNDSPLGDRLNGAEVVGVVRDVRFPANPAQPATPYQTYRPYAQEPRGFLNLAVRGPVAGSALQRAVADVDADQPVGQAGPARAEVARSLDHWAIGGRLLSLFSALGLGMTLLGVYGVIAGFVARRTGEIGVRIALGAQIRSVLWLVLGQGLRLSFVGAVLGLVGAFGFARLLSSVLPELPAANGWLLLAVAVGLVAVTLLACWLPARRAARTDPMEALRNE